MTEQELNNETEKAILGNVFITPDTVKSIFRLKLQYEFEQDKSLFKTIERLMGLENENSKHPT